MNLQPYKFEHGERFGKLTVLERVYDATDAATVLAGVKLPETLRAATAGSVTA